jgi:hypothetical protein
MQWYLPELRVVLSCNSLAASATARNTMLSTAALQQLAALPQWHC